MTEKKSYAPGTFCWVDYVAHDMEEAGRWYAELFGWQMVSQDTQGGPPYAMFLKGEHAVAGIGQMSAEMKASGVPPMWNDYVAVDDVDDVAKRAAALGATVSVPPMQVMDAGWLAFFVDPTGAHFAVWKAGEHHGAQVVNEHGALSWNELVTKDVEKAKGFYGELFGWTFDTEAMPQGDYVVIKNGERDNGGIMAMEGPHWEGIPPHWMTYFAVDDCDAVVEAAAASGGKVAVPPVDIPPGRFAVLQDPHGGTFTVIKLNAPA